MQDISDQSSATSELWWLFARGSDLYDRGLSLNAVFPGRYVQPVKNQRSSLGTFRSFEAMFRSAQDGALNCCAPGPKTEQEVFADQEASPQTILPAE